MLDKHYDFQVIPSPINQGSGLPTQHELEGHCDENSHATARRMIPRRCWVNVPFFVFRRTEVITHKKPARSRTFIVSVLGIYSQVPVYHETNGPKNPPPSGINHKRLDKPSPTARRAAAKG